MKDKRRKEKTKKICVQCHKEFFVSPYYKEKRIFCSHKCWAEHKKIPIEKVCKQCGEKFVVSPSLERLKFCSHKCYWKNLEGKPNFALRKRITIQCKICNKKMDVPLNLSNKKYCSRKCKDISLIGKRVSPQTEFQKGIHSKEKHYNWRGGISKEPYPFDFDDELKELIRKRDNYKCQLCSVPQEECLKKLSIHHIDYDKSNLDPKNLMSLCNNCNLKVNHNREYWTNFFQNKLLEIK